MISKKEKLRRKRARDIEYNLECAMDGFFGRVRECKYCKTPTEFNHKEAVRYCPKGCFKGDKVNSSLVSSTRLKSRVSAKQRL